MNIQATTAYERRTTQFSDLVSKRLWGSFDSLDNAALVEITEANDRIHKRYLRRHQARLKPILTAMNIHNIDNVGAYEFSCIRENWKRFVMYENNRSVATKIANRACEPEMF